MIDGPRPAGPVTAAKYAGGFTLLELMVVVFIVAISAALAMPGFRETTTRSTVTTIGNDLVGALAQARSEAVKRGLHVAVKGKNGGSDWSSGWDVVVDTTRDSSFATNLVTREAVKRGFKVTTNGASPARVVFSAQGDLVGAGEFHINVCRDDKRPDLSRFIRVRTSGEVTSQRNTSASNAPGC